MLCASALPPAEATVHSCVNYSRFANDVTRQVQYTHACGQDGSAQAHRLLVPKQASRVFMHMSLHCNLIPMHLLLTWAALRFCSRLCCAALRAACNP